MKIHEVVVFLTTWWGQYCHKKNKAIVEVAILFLRLLRADRLKAPTPALSERCLISVCFVRDLISITFIYFSFRCIVCNWGKCIKQVSFHRSNRYLDGCYSWKCWDYFRTGLFFIWTLRNNSKFYNVTYYSRSKKYAGFDMNEVYMK